MCIHWSDFLANSSHFRGVSDTAIIVINLELNLGVRLVGILSFMDAGSVGD